MFPGQGSQRVGMGRDWVENFNEAKLAFEEASDGCGLRLQKLCFEGSDDDLKKTEITQPAILTATVAAFRSMVAHSRLGERLPNALFAGHSLGEYSALVCAGAVSLGDAARLVHHRGSYMQQAVPAGTGAMAALVFKPKTEGNWEKSVELCQAVARATGKKVSPANDNSPEQIVIAGELIAVQEASRLATTEPWGARKAVPLPVSAPFHCALMQPAADRLAPELKNTQWQSVLGRRYVANVDAALTPVGPEAVEKLIHQITGAVLWTRSVRAALAQGYTQALEIGPGSVLTGLARRIALEGQSLEGTSVDSVEDFRSVEARI